MIAFLDKSGWISESACSFSADSSRRRSAVDDKYARAVVSPSAENVDDETTRVTGRSTKLLASLDVPTDIPIPYCIEFFVKYAVFRQSVVTRDRRYVYRVLKRYQLRSVSRFCRENPGFRFSCQCRSAIFRQLSRPVMTHDEWSVCA
jgi:hypothetical protein